MQRLISRVLFVLCVSLAISLALFPDVASAQAGAQEAFQKAQATFKAGNFADAQKFAEEASQTDTKNPEVFLLLGKAHYQQGHLEEALKAWKKTLALAPKQPYAQKMLDALQAEQKDIDLRIKLLEAMSDRKLSQTGLFECHRLLSNKAITNAQRAAIMMLQAKMHLRAGEHKRALETLQKVKVLYPKHIDPAQILLLTGQAKLHLDQKSIAEGIAALEEVLERHPKHSAATVAKYGLILFLLQQEVTAERTDALAKWLATHKNHDLALEGFEQLLKAYMMLSLRDVKPNPDSPMSKGDQMVFAIAGELYQRSFDVDYTKAITQKLLKHIETRYMNREAYTAAVEATDTLLKTPLSQADRLAVLKFSLTPKMNIAMKWLQEQARTGQLANDRGKSELPKVLVDLRTVYETIRKEYPANAHWQKQVELACRVKKFAQKVPWPREITEARLPEQWAMELALPAIKANATPAAVRSAIRMVLEIGLQVPRTNMASRKLAVSFSSQLMEIVPVEHDMWRDVAHTYCTLLKETANYTFNKNIKAGRPEANAKFSASQEAILDTMEKFVKAYGDYAPIALQQLSEFCKPLVEHNHWKLVEEAHMRIAMVLPESQRQQVELALGNLWLKKVSDEHQRLTGAGLTVPRKLDPIHTKILTRCYELQAEYDRDSIELKMIRSLQDRIVNHYKILEYYDIAKKAIRVKAKTPVKAADEYAAFSLIRLDEQLAQREFDRLMKQYNASEKTEIKTAFDKVLDRWIKFIAERPTSPLVHSAVEHVFSIGQLLERKQVYGGAVAVYEKFAKEAAKIKVLNQAKPHETTITQRAAFAAACAEDAKARAALKKWIADRKSDDPAPTELSKEFTAAIGAYKKFITTYPKNSQVAYAMEKIMAIACEYTKIDAWDVADSIFADLLKDKATFRHPERLKFARGLCQLGHARPEHARKLLKVLAQNGMLRSANEPNTSQMLAANFQNMHLYGLEVG
ncbi:MAG: CDC27 family protein, partial [Planctomycetia bacterium]